MQNPPPPTPPLSLSLSPSLSLYTEYILHCGIDLCSLPELDLI